MTGRRAALGTTELEIERVYRLLLPRFRRVAAAILGDRDAGCDAVQDAVAVALRKRGSYRGEGTLEAWLWRLVVNTARNHARRRRPLALADPTSAHSRRPPPCMTHA